MPTAKMTDAEALEALKNLSPRRDFDINFVLAHTDKGVLHDIHHPEKWYLDIARINGDGKWEYDGKTLGECVEQAVKHEET